MNERERLDVIKCVCSYTCARENVPLRVKCIASSPLTTHQFSAQSVQPFIRKWGAHMLTCTVTHTPALTSVKHLANGSLCKMLNKWVSTRIPKFSAICTTFFEIPKIGWTDVQPFPRYVKGGSSARAHVRTGRCTPPMCDMHRCLVSKHTKFDNNRPSYSLAANLTTFTRHTLPARVTLPPPPQISQIRL